MKDIKITCYDNGRASIEVSDLHINNENKASTIKIDFTNTSQLGVNKWVDLVAKNGTSLRYDLGIEDEVSIDLTYASTFPGELIITPFAYDGFKKVKYIPNHNIVIRNQEEAGNEAAMLRDDFIFDLVARIEAIENGEIDMDVTIVGSEIAIDVNIQDQTSPAIIAKFKNEIAKTVSTIITTINGNTITVSSPTGFSIGKYATVISPLDVKFYLGEVVAVNGSVITLDTPFDFAYPVGSVISVSNTNMAVDGSLTTQIFCIRGDEGVVDVAYDVTRIMIAGLCATAPDLSKFGDLAKLTYGLVLRRVDGTIKNIFNVKSNSELRNIMYDFELSFADNPSHGQDGFNGRITFAGQNKMGVAIRLAPGDDLEILVQDNLIGLVSLEIIAEGHLVVNDN